jgi:UDP-N-acetylmuramyl pentapeptide synthase
MVASNGAVVLNDTYNANPDSTIVALETLASLKPKQGGRRIAVLADMKELGSCSADEHAKIGRAIATMAKIDLAIFHGDEMRRAYESLAAEGKGAQRFFFADKSKLADWLASMLAPADVLLVKGSRGMKMEDVVGRVVGKTTDRN